MTFIEQLADDFLVADGLEPVTLERTDGAPPTVVAHALRRAVATAEADASGGKYTANDTVWNLPSSELTSPPRLGDRLVDAQGTRWTMIEVDSLTLGSRIRCRARNLALAEGLDQQVNILRASWTQVPDGSPIAAWNLWRVNVAARVQPLAAAAIEEDARTQTRRRVKVYLAEPLPLDHNDRVAHGANVYRIVSCERSEALEHLQTLVVELVETADA